MFNLNKGMTLADVNATLMCGPYQLLQHTDGGYLMLEYKYIHAKRSVNAEHVDMDEHRLDGKPAYADIATFYALFDNDQKLVQYVTSAAMDDLKDMYASEATAQKLGSFNTPCTSNCVILRPGEQMVVAGTEEPEEEPEEKPKSALGGLAAGLGGGLGEGLGAGLGGGLPKLPALPGSGN